MLLQASEGRTTIVIAHRLSTVKSANKIVALSDGQVGEEGTHTKLMARKGVYYNLYTRQSHTQEERCNDGDTDDKVRSP